MSKTDPTQKGGCTRMLAMGLKQKLLKQGYVVLRLESTLQNFYDRHHELVG
jgi:hypothetical protein